MVNKDMRDIQKAYEDGIIMGENKILTKLVEQLLKIELKEKIELS